MVLTFVQNIALIISVAVLHHFVVRRLGRQPALVSALNGALFGLASIMAMSTTFTFAPGIIYDGRTIIIGAAALFGGPFVAATASCIAVLYRIFIVGGSGYLAGVLCIAEAAIVGTCFNLRQKRVARPFSRGEIVLIAYLIHILMLLCQFALPSRRWAQVIPVIAPAVLTLYPLGFYLICALFADNEERLRAQLALEESEARYKSLFMNHHTVMLLIDTENGGIVDANPAAEAFYGWPREELRRMGIADINILSLEEIRRCWDEIESTNRRMFQMRHRLASNAIVDVEVFSGPIEYKGKKLFYSIVHDATSRIQAEREVQSLNRTLELRVARRTRELEEANEELEAFSYSVSHDLRTPLRAISGYADLLSEASGPQMAEEPRGYLDRILRNAAKMNSLIDDLLRLSRIGSQDLQYSTVQLSAMAEQIMAELRAKTPERSVSARIDPGMSVVADRALMEVLLVNLLSNAWKFTSKKLAASIVLSAEQHNGETIYSVEDDGVGFDARYADKLFIPFQRLHAPKDYEGSGIGLSIVKRIIERHGGRIWAESEPDKGARFSFTLDGQVRNE